MALTGRKCDQRKNTKVGNVALVRIMAQPVGNVAQYE